MDNRQEAIKIMAQHLAPYGVTVSSGLDELYDLLIPLIRRESSHGCEHEKLEIATIHRHPLPVCADCGEEIDRRTPSQGRRDYDLVNHTKANGDFKTLWGRRLDRRCGNGDQRASQS